MVHEDGGKVVPYRPVDEHGGRCGIHAPGEADNGPVIPDLRPYLLDRVCDDVDRGPIRRAGADLEEKVLEDVHPVLRVLDLRMELHPEEAPLRLFEGDDRYGRGLGRHPEPFGWGQDGVAVARPRLLLIREPREEQAMLLHVKVRASILPDLDGLDLAAHLEGHKLHPVADT